MSTSFDLDTRIREVHRLISTAHSHYQVWWLYSNVNTRPKYLDTMNDYPGFFQASIHAHFTTMFVYCYKIFDKGYNVMSLLTAYEMALKAGKLSQDTVDFVEEGLKTHAATMAGIRLVRNKCSAHLDDKAEHRSIFKQASLSPNRIRDFILWARDAMNHIDVDVRESTHDLSDFAAPALTRLRTNSPYPVLPGRLKPSWPIEAMRMYGFSSRPGFRWRRSVTRERPRAAA